MNFTVKIKRFVEEYCKDFNATQAAIRAGYSSKTAYSIGHENLNKPEIREAIKKRLDELALTAEETTKIISDIAKSDLSEYYVIEDVVYTPNVCKSLKTIIKETEEKIEFEKLFAQQAQLQDKELERHNALIDQMGKDLIRLKLELKQNPKATRIVPGEPQLRKDARLDMVKLVQDKERGRIKTVAPNEFGYKIELYSALDASNMLARIHGKFEKDNKQLQPKVNNITDEQFSKLLKSARETKAHKGE